MQAEHRNTHRNWYQMKNGKPPSFPANRGMQAAAGVLLLLPIVALMWVGSYARVEPREWCHDP